MGKARRFASEGPAGERAGGPNRRALLRSAAWGLAAALVGGSAVAQAGPLLRVVVLGDSLSAGFLLDASMAFPAVLERALRQRGLAVSVANAGVTNDTTWDGFARLDRDVPAGTDGVILELGANDKLSRTDPDVTRSYLEAIVRRLAARRIPVLLAGIRFPKDVDADMARFNAVFADVARRHHLALYPDFYAGLWGEPRLKTFDGVHPSAEGVRRIVAGILPVAERFVRGLPARSVLPSRSSSRSGPIAQ